MNPKTTFFSRQGMLSSSKSPNQKNSKEALAAMADDNANPDLEEAAMDDANQDSNKSKDDDNTESAPNENIEDGAPRKGSDDAIVAASNDLSSDAQQSKKNANDVVVVEAKTEHDAAIKQQSQQQATGQEAKSESVSVSVEDETAVREINIPSLLTIKFDEEKHCLLTQGRDSFALYQVSVCCNTEKQTAWTLYLRYSDMDVFHRRLSYHHNRLYKYNTAVRARLVLPKLPPKKQWQRNKLDKTFIDERVRLLNIYCNELSKYVSNSTQNIQDLYLQFFEISNNLYKYIIHGDLEMLNELHKYDANLLLHAMDENKSNIFHYAVSQKAIDCINAVLTMYDDEADKKQTISALLSSKDQFHWTPLSLSQHINDSDEIYNMLKPYCASQEDEETKADDVDGADHGDHVQRMLPAQYKYNVHSQDYKHILWIIINPFSGTGQGVAVWENAIKPFLDFHADRIEYETLVTTKQFHAQTECQTLSADHKYNGIVCIGGDGTIAEVINGLYYNTNLQSKLCVTPISAGSGNALAKELKVENIVVALRKLVGGFETCIDAYIASQVGQQDTYSFVSTEWAAISTIDLESESYRWMGSLRFTVKGVSEVAWSSHYKARLYFKPIDAASVSELANNDYNKNRTPNDDENWWAKLPDLGLDDEQTEKQNEEKAEKADGGGNEKNDQEEKVDAEAAAESRPCYPSDWVCVEAEFGLLCVTNLQWISEDTCMGGTDFDCKTNTLRLVYNEKVGRMNYASILLGMETGKHLELDFVKFFDVEEVVIEPLIKGPPIDVDGERKPLKPVYVKLLASDFVVTC